MMQPDTKRGHPYDRACIYFAITVPSGVFYSSYATAIWQHLLVLFIKTDQFISL